MEFLSSYKEIFVLADRTHDDIGYLKNNTIQSQNSLKRETKKDLVWYEPRNGEKHDWTQQAQAVQNARKCMKWTKGIAL